MAWTTVLWSRCVVGCRGVVQLGGPDPGSCLGATLPFQAHSHLGDSIVTLYTDTQADLVIEYQVLISRINLIQDELHVCYTLIITLLIVILYMEFPIQAKHVVGLHVIQISLHNILSRSRSNRGLNMKNCRCLDLPSLE